jgi:transcriptional regulator with XRE-family HTH domain
MAKKSKAKKDNSAEDYLSAIGENIRRNRRKSGYTLEKLGDAIGLDKGNMHKIEAGKNVTVLTLLKIAQCLEIAPAKFLDVKVSSKKAEKKSAPKKGNKSKNKKRKK